MEKLQNLIREKAAKCLFFALWKRESASGRILNLWTESNVANNYKSFTVFDSHRPFAVADGVLVGVDSGLGWCDSKICKNLSEKNPRSCFSLLCRNGGTAIRRILNTHGPFTVADGVLVGVGYGLGWYTAKSA
jgi:hypothetical protein